MILLPNNIRYSRQFSRALCSFLTLVVVLFAMPSHAAELKYARFCIWDPVGTTGPFVSFLKETKLKAISWGVELDLDTYTDEKVAANDFRSERCDAVFLTHILSKDFIPFAAAFGAPGGVRSLDELKTLSASINNPKALKYIQHGRYELTGLFPIGEVYPFLKDKADTSIGSLSGKKVTILNGDMASLKFVEMVGASPVHTTLATWSGQFNNGNVDVLFGPALAYNTFELYKGLEAHGGIIDYNILYAVMMMVIKTEKFPEGFGQKMRKHALTRFKELEKTVKQSTREIPDKYWIRLSDDDKNEFEDIGKKIRLALRDDKEYDPKAISLLWKIRCKHNPSATECSQRE